jgi:superfamily II DNA or RNA helicase/HKD family nuclease
MSRDKNLIDLISSYKTKMMDEPEVDLPDNLQWLLDQFQFLIRNKLTKFNNQSERVNYLNHLTSNLFNLKNGRYLSKVDSVNDKWLDELTTTKIYDKEIYKNIISELETCEEAIIVSPFISFNIIELKNTIESNKKLKRLTVLTTTFGFREKMNINLDLLKKIKEINPEVIDIKIENVTENNALKRLHAKAYYFKRENQLSSLYIGSSNFSHTGLNTGLEYNMKISEFTNPHIFESFLQYVRNIEESEMHNDDDESFKQNTMENNFYNINNKFFMGYLTALKVWVDNNKQKIAEQLKNLDLTQESINGDVKIPKSFEIENALFKYQIDAIKQLDARFVEGKRQHLLAMATGTGKTTIAVSYVNEISKRNGFLYKPSVLFIAHRTEILDQAKERFIDWGVYDKEDILELYDSRAKGSSLDSSKFKLILGSVSTLNNNLERLQKQKFDITIFDEAHHIDAEGAKTFNNIFEIGKEISNEVLGMSATPERTNGNNIIDLFGGEFAYTLSVYDALEKEYLAPFDYYMLHSDDVIDFDFSKKSNENQLTKFMNTEERFKLLTQAINSCINADENICCVIFCNSRKTAKYMSDRLNAIGKKADYLISPSDQKGDRKEDQKKDWKEERKKILRNFKTGVINYLCVVDIFNEGIDIPEINHVIFLRPTSSKLIFIQQLGRGLRKFNDKRLQIIDIVNNINIDKNTTYNPLKYLSELTKEGLQISSVYDDVRIIDKLIPERCSFHIDLEDAKKIKALLYNISKSNAKKKHADALQGSYEKKDYGSYKTFVKTNYIDIQSVYDKNFSFLNLDANWQQGTLMILSHINMRDVIIKLQEIINSKQLSNNKIVNNLFIKMIFNAKKPFYGEVSNEDAFIKEMFEMITDNLLVEFNFLCKYKLEETKLLTNTITNELSSFVGIKIQSHLILALLNESVIDKLNMSVYSPSACFLTRENTQTIYIQAYEDRRTGDTSVIKYQNKFDTTKNEFLWISSWNVNDEKKRSQSYSKYKLKKEYIENNEKYKYLVLELKEDNGWDNKHIFTYLGATKKCTRQIKDNGDIIYTFDLNG